LCPCTRNLTDEQIEMVGKSGGVIGILFEPRLLFNDDDMPLSEIARHIDYIANRIGVDHVALGSDFDGADTPSELKDVSYLPKLIDILRKMGKSGYDKETVEKIAWKNWLRVIKETWREE
jgi:membrane dipeptidase